MSARARLAPPPAELPDRADPAAHQRPRRAYSYRTAALDYSQTVSALRKAVEAGRIRTRRVGGGVRLHPDDLEREFGFPVGWENSPVSEEVALAAARLAASLRR